MPPVVRTRPFVLLSVILFAVMTMVAAQLVTDGPVTSQPPLKAQRAAHLAQRAALKEAAAVMAAAIVRPMTPPPSPPPAPPTTTTTAPDPSPAPTSAPVPPATVAATPAPGGPGAVPPVGQATAWGCSAALAYLQAYAARGSRSNAPATPKGGRR